MTIYLRNAACVGLLLLALRAGAAAGMAGRSATSIQPAFAGTRLSDAEAQALERQVKAAPNDVAARSQLLGYYFRRVWTSPEARTARDQHVLWLIRNQPETPVLATPYAQM